MAEMILRHSSGSSCSEAVERQIPLHNQVRKYGQALGSAIVVASEAAPGLLRSCFRSNVGVNADGGSHGTEPPVPENRPFDFEKYNGNLKNYTHISPALFSYLFHAFESLFSLEFQLKHII